MTTIAQIKKAEQTAIQKYDDNIHTLTKVSSGYYIAIHRELFFEVYKNDSGEYGWQVDCKTHMNGDIDDVVTQDTIAPDREIDCQRVVYDRASSGKCLPERPQCTQPPLA